jgi:hypothetical protein
MTEVFFMLLNMEMKHIKRKFGFDPVEHPSQFRRAFALESDERSGDFRRIVFGLNHQKEYLPQIRQKHKDILLKYAQKKKTWADYKKTHMLDKILKWDLWKFSDEE